MVETLKTAKKFRPKGSWGYYHFPYCFTNGTERQCAKAVRDENDSLMEIHELSDNLYPSVYLKSCFKEEEHVRYIETSMVEAVRIKDKCASDKKIWTYFWYKFSDTQTFIPREDLVKSLTAIVKYDIHGIILWGASADVDSASGCEEVYEYIDHTFGPILRALFKF
ncbi:unnamed protein product [Ceutorhynchus assimilis]|uniref:Hyaluronidase n=1 Tax=Ceutorhynchus assimilis TaxID=467358 RepID=A0A9N9QQ72_9CUCU|nr:unnamed protein product [Ceutorhynchus assimilis]